MTRGDRKARGVHDPWRAGVPDPEVEAAREAAAAERQEDLTRPVPVGAAGSDHPVDWDLRPSCQFTIRATTHHLRVEGAQTPGEALDRLMAIANDCEGIRGCLEARGFVVKPITECVGFVLCGTQQEMRPGVFAFNNPAVTDGTDGVREFVAAFVDYQTEGGPRGNNRANVSADKAFSRYGLDIVYGS